MPCPQHSRRRNIAAIRWVLGAVLAWVVLAEPAWGQQAGREPRGLPPAPRFIPGTEITPETEPKALPAVRGRKKSAPAQRVSPQAAELPAMAGDTAADPRIEGDAAHALPPSLIRSGEPAVDANHPVWGKLAALLPKPGEFAIIPGSSLRPVLVQDGEFPFCDAIKCHRSGAVLGAWNGGAFDAERGQFRLHGGGHADYGGNEIYVFDFPSLKWSRETEPQALTGPLLKDTDGDEIADACPAPASGPPATHTYQGFVYVPKIDRHWLFGTVAYCSGAMAGQLAWEYDANTRTWTAMPDLDRYAKFARAVVNPATGNVFIHVGRRKGWHEIDPRAHSLVRSYTEDPFGSYTDGPALFDARRQVIYAVISGNKTDRLVAYSLPEMGAGGSADGFRGRLVAQWPKRGLKAWGLAQHASGLLVLWDGNTRVLAVDPQTGRSWDMATGGEDYGPDRRGGQPARVYSKWAYIEEADTFFGITSATRGVVLYRLGGSVLAEASGQSPEKAAEREESIVQAVDPLPKEPARRSETSGRGVLKLAGRRAAPPVDHGWEVPLEIEDFASWEPVCNQAILCDPMGDGEVVYRGRVVEAGPPQRRAGWRTTSLSNHPDAKEPTADPTIGGLRFTFPSLSGSGAAGNFSINFSPDYSFQVGPQGTAAAAQEVFIQFQVRYSCTFIWTDCDPQSANYRKERRCFLSKRGNGRCTTSKIALISSGDREDARADACTRIQTAINHGAGHNLHGFHRCPRAAGFGQRLPRQGGRFQGNSQPNGLYYCPRILGDGRDRGWNNSPDSCFRLIDEQWITIQIRLRFGPWQSDHRKGEPALSHASIWAATEGQAGGRQRLVIDNDFYAADPKGKDLVGKIWLMPHLYNKTNKEDHPPFFVWYRNLVISQTLVPNPS